MHIVHAGDKFIESLCLNLFCIIYVIYVYYDYCIQSLVTTLYICKLVFFTHSWHQCTS